MPTESLPWGRKEAVFKDRRHERGPGHETPRGGFGWGDGGGSSSSSSSCFTPRFREAYHGPRDFSRDSPRRHMPGHYKQGGNYHQFYGEEYRSGERLWVEGDAFKSPPPTGRYNNGGRSGYGRENRGYLRRSPHWEPPGDFSRHPHHEMPSVTAPRSIAVPVTPPPPPPPAKPSPRVSVDPSSRVSVDASSRVSVDLSSGVPVDPPVPVCSADDGLVDDDKHDLGKKSEQDHSLGSISWKPMKWARSGSFSSSKANRTTADVEAADPLVPPGKDIPAPSPLTCAQGAEDGALKKRPRLGWGQGLAKYEKQKVVESEDVIGKNTLIPCNGTSSLVTVTSPNSFGYPGCQSPVTPFSIVSSASPGLEDKLCTNTDDVLNDSCLSAEFSGSGLANSSEDLSIKLEHTVIDPHGSLSKLISNLLEPESAFLCDTSFARHTSMSELVLLKDIISKELEKTECHIDQFENELKSLESIANNDCGQNCSSPPDDSSFEPSKPLDSDSVFCLSRSPLPESTRSMTAVSERELNLCLNDSDDRTSGTSISKFSNSEHVSKVFSNDSNQASASSDVTVVDGLKIDHLVSSVASCRNHCVNMQSDDHFAESSHQNSSNDLVELVLSTNTNAARMASNALNGGILFDVWGSEFISSLGKNNMRVSRKLSIRKRQQKVRDRILVFKYQSFLHLWKEDLRLLSIRRQRPKTNKRLELSVRSSNGSFQMHHSHIKPRFASPSNLGLVPTPESMDFANKLLLDSQVKVFRSNLKMPALFSDDERRYSRFLTTNGLIQDPVSFEKEKARVNPWTQEEKKIFMEKLCTLGKDFNKIASFFESKTVADCIEFYYKNHKCDDFGEVMKCLDERKNAQVSYASGYLFSKASKQPREMGAVSLDAPVASAQQIDCLRSPQKISIWPVRSARNAFQAPLGRHGSTDEASSGFGLRRVKENATAENLAGITGTISSEAMNSCITSSIGPVEMIPSLTSGFPRYIDEEETYSDEDCGEFEYADWTDEEKSVFINALCMYGKDFTRISRCVATKTWQQCQVFFSKARKCLRLDVISQGPHSRTSLKSYANVRSCDTDDVCAAEMDSAICSTLSSKIDSFVQCGKSGSFEDFIQSGCASLQFVTDGSSENYGICKPEHWETENKLDELASNFTCDRLPKKGDDQDSFVGGLKEIRHSAICEGSMPVIVSEGTSIKGTSSSPSSTIKALATYDSGACSKLELDPIIVQQNNKVAILGHSDQKENMLQCRVTEPPLDGFKQGNINASSNKSGFPCFSSDYHTDEHGTRLGNEVNIRPSFNLPRKHRHQKRHQKRQDIISASTESLSRLPDPSRSSFADPLLSGLLPGLASGESGIKLLQDPLTRKLCQKYLMESPLLNQSSTPSGTHRGNGDAEKNLDISGSSSLLGSNRRCASSGLIEPNPEPFDSSVAKSGVHYPKLDGGMLSPPTSEVLFPSCIINEQGKVNDRPRPRPWSAGSAPVELRCDTGDIKLFGKVLGSKSSLAAGDCYPHSRSGSELEKPVNSQTTSMPQNAFAALGSWDFPLQSYGFWDGTRIQTGFLTLPEAAAAAAASLSKYQQDEPGVLPAYAVNSAPPKFPQPFPQC